eukprot:scaffold5880_cov32-Tisochrysis_lutea.AAC.6
MEEGALDGHNPRMAQPASRGDGSFNALELIHSVLLQDRWHATQRRALDVRLAGYDHEMVVAFIAPIVHKKSSVAQQHLDVEARTSRSIQQLVCCVGLHYALCADGELREVKRDACVVAEDLPVPCPGRGAKRCDPRHDIIPLTQEGG